MTILKTNTYYVLGTIFLICVFLYIYLVGITLSYYSGSVGKFTIGDNTNNVFKVVKENYEVSSSIFIYSKHNKYQSLLISDIENLTDLALKDVEFVSFEENNFYSPQHKLFFENDKITKIILSWGGIKLP